MLYSSIAFLAFAGSLLPLVTAHGWVKSVETGGQSYPGHDPSAGPGDKKEGLALRAVQGDQGPVPMDSAGIACSKDDIPSDVHADVTAGSDVTFEWGTWLSEHLGPVTHYMASCRDSCGGVDATTLDWFKIAEAGYENGAFATTIISKTGEYTVQVPEDIAPGAYLLREELLALHGAPQFYPVCLQLQLASSGSLQPSENLVKFPGAYNGKASELAVNVWGDASTLEGYKIPGLPMYNGEASPQADTVPQDDTPGRADASAQPAGSSATPSDSTSGAVAGFDDGSYKPEAQLAQASNGVETALISVVTSKSGAGNIKTQATSEVEEDMMSISLQRGGVQAEESGTGMLGSGNASEDDMTLSSKAGSTNAGSAGHVLLLMVIAGIMRCC